MKVKLENSGRSAVRFSLGRKLTAAFFAVSLLVGATAGAAYSFLDRLESNYSSLLDKHTGSMELVAKIEMDTQRQNSLLFGYLIEPSADKEKQLFETNGQLGTVISTMVSASNSGEKEEAVRTLSESNDTFARLLVKIKDYVSQNRPDLAKAEALMWSIPLTDTMNDAAEQLRTTEKAALQSELVRYQEQSKATVRTLIICSITVLIIAISIGLILSKLIVKPMRLMLRTVGEMAAGDLTVAPVEVRNRDEIRELAAAFNGMKSNWNGMISDLGRHAVKVAGSAEKLRQHSNQFMQSSEEISAIMGQISAGTEEQVKSVDLGVSTASEMSFGVSEIAGLADQADRQSAHALQETETGERIVTSTVAQMQVIQRQMRDLSEFIDRLGVRSEKIVDASALIANISQQTQMLALNASIEAARAGEAGKGFAVVAQEVRKLSVQTGVAADEVSELARAVGSETEFVIEAAKAGTQEVAAGLSKVNQAGEAFSSIRLAVKEVAEQIGRVSQQADRLTEHSGAAVHAIRSIDQVAKQTADGSREVYAHTEEQHAGVQEMMAAMDGLTQLSEELQAMIRKFKV
ncbi:methyl-accepting chemotaxis protein [Paenibacillus alkaliterrae]|uniref:methyl-accepting chemotaxis protein n=1 Tax=Paenibacillus alkaliterrae TaxID=320909 RepID=UPI001F3B45F7|nr:methyl-accepting chemotaxis protein [Paenibacillus alkaliterrae]MCF2941540.1 methyl-accepting chemotaxis protein [Paenibacillus alkaliterrae]